MVVHRLQQFAEQRQVRVTFVAGDVHCTAVGRFFDPALTVASSDGVSAGGSSKKSTNKTKNNNKNNNKTHGVPGTASTGDPRLMYQIVSSAIVNAAPPAVVMEYLHGNAQTRHKLDKHTREEMVPTFFQDVDGRPPCKKNETKLLGRRNWCLVDGAPSSGGSTSGSTSTNTSRSSSDTSDLYFSIQVEAVAHTKPSVAYKVIVPGLQ